MRLSMVRLTRNPERIGKQSDAPRTLGKLLQVLDNQRVAEVKLSLLRNIDLLSTTPYSVWSESRQAKDIPPSNNVHVWVSPLLTKVALPI